MRLRASGRCDHRHSRMVEDTAGDEDSLHARPRVVWSPPSRPRPAPLAAGISWWAAGSASRNLQLARGPQILFQPRQLTAVASWDRPDPGTRYQRDARPGWPS